MNGEHLRLGFTKEKPPILVGDHLLTAPGSSEYHQDRRNQSQQGNRYHAINYDFYDRLHVVLSEYALRCSLRAGLVGDVGANTFAEGREQFP
jgi:hypothetical protein